MTVKVFRRYFPTDCFSYSLSGKAVCRTALAILALFKICRRNSHIFHSSTTIQFLLPISRILPSGSLGNWWLASTMSLVNLAKVQSWRIIKLVGLFRYLVSSSISACVAGLGGCSSTRHLEEGIKGSSQF